MPEKKIVKCPKCQSPYDVSKYAGGITFQCAKCKSPVEYKPPAPAQPKEAPTGDAGMESEFLIVEDSVMNADLILVLDEGRIVERGTHAELATAGGIYEMLCEVQFKRAQEKLDEHEAAARRE